jgi:hypothetical protein
MRAAGYPVNPAQIHNGNTIYEAKEVPFSFNAQNPFSAAFLASKFHDHRKTQFPRQSFDSTAANQRLPQILCNR